MIRKSFIVFSLHVLVITFMFVLAFTASGLCSVPQFLFLLSCNVMKIFVRVFPDTKERSAKRFSVGGVFNYTSLLLSQEDDMLYVGAREALFALSLSDISKTKLQKNVCLIPGGLSKAKMAIKKWAGR